MKLLIVFCNCLLMFWSPAFSQTDAALVKSVQAKLEKINDYEATGKMKIDVSYINAPESEVTVYYKRPDKFKVIKSGGISILPKGGMRINLNSLLLSERFTVVGAGTAMLNGMVTRVEKLLPLDENSSIVLTTLYIDAKNLVIRKASVATKESGTYEMLLDYGKFTALGLPDRVIFTFDTKDFKLPKGMTFDYDKGNAKEDTRKSTKGTIQISYTNYKVNKGIPDSVFPQTP